MERKTKEGSKQALQELGSKRALFQIPRPHTKLDAALQVFVVPTLLQGDERQGQENPWKV